MDAGSAPADTIIFKIVPADLWAASESRGAFTGSPVDERDGFIHLSTAAQVRETAARHFAGQTNLLLVAVDTAAVTIRWEPSRGGDLFPHVYGDVPMRAVRWVQALPLDPSGAHIFPPIGEPARK